ncbi:MAG: chemotaxis protein CheW [Phycisphaerae bacterium]
MATTTTTLENSTQVAGGHGGKYLTFALGKEEYGLEILTVREIMGMMEITAIPRVPGYVRGVVNLRGQVIAVVDLRAKFGMETVAQSDQTCIIMVEIKHGNRKLSTGIIVDRVSEVLDIPGHNIEEAPEFGASMDTNFILGMGKVGEKVKILLDISKVLDSAEVAQITAHAQAAPAAPVA